MTAEDFQRAVYETAVITFIGSGGFAAGHGRHAYNDTLASNARIGMELVADGNAGLTTMDDVDRVNIGDGSTPDESTGAPALPTTQDVAVPAGDTAIGNGAESAPMLSPGVFDTFTRTGTDPDARVPDSEKVHSNITILRPRTAGKGAPLDISSEEAAPFREEFDRDHRAAEGFEVRKEFIPAATEADARAEYARRHGHAAPQSGWKTRPAAVWVNDQDASIISFRDAQERDAWREDQIRSRHIIENRGNDASEPAGINYEEAVKEHPFLDVMATIRHDSAKFNVQTGTFSMTSSQGGRTYELAGNISGSNIHIRGLFPVGEDSHKAGTNSFGSDFLVTVLAFSRQMPGMTITANAARGDGMNGYAMWPKLGFEAKNPVDILGGRKIPKVAATRMKELADTGEGNLSLIKLNSTPEGQRLWKEHGGSIDVYFDTNSSSPSMLVFSGRSIRQYQRNFARSKKVTPDQNPDLPSH